MDDPRDTAFRDLIDSVRSFNRHPSMLRRDEVELAAQVVVLAATPYRTVWWCEDAAEDSDSECFYEADRAERQELHGGHRECGDRLLLKVGPVVPNGDER